MRARLTYFVSAYGSDMLVPSIAHVGVKRATPSGDMLNIWPLWYKTTEDMHGFAYQPNYPDNTADRRGCSDLATAHRNEAREQCYAAQDDEAGPLPGCEILQL